MASRSTVLQQEAKLHYGPEGMSLYDIKLPLLCSALEAKNDSVRLDRLAYDQVSTLDSFCIGCSSSL